MNSPDCVLEPSSSSLASGNASALSGSGGCNGGGGGGGSNSNGGVVASAEQSFFGASGGLCYSAVDRNSDRAPPQLATFSSPPPVFSTPCRWDGHKHLQIVWLAFVGIGLLYCRFVAFLSGFFRSCRRGRNTGLSCVNFDPLAW